MKSKKIIEAIKILAGEIGRPLNIMEVCGTHTVSIFRSGIKSILPSNINLVAGPGCPVCVTSVFDIDKAIFLARKKDTILLTYGDLFKVPGSKENLEAVKASGEDVRIIYSALDAIKIAKENPKKEVVFATVGFETTAPATAVLLEELKTKKIKNLSIFSMHKTVPEALVALLKNPQIKIDAFLLPGHVSTVIGGVKAYQFISKEYKKPAVVSGFEAQDILESLLLLLLMFKEKKAEIKIQYQRIVSKEGNKEALKILDKVFKKTGAEWRGLGVIKNSGLKLNNKFVQFDAEKRFKIKVAPAKENSLCQCGKIIQGLKEPSNCLMFGKACTPQNPKGPCMVSSEGTCAAYYKYGNLDVRV